ncbi:GAF domain-containing protein [Dactylosporangium cerinum]|uniref:GAF domain-containing protein n=1 Tax=Dactylosporangium cerinum TaxID=1434730 RepID=A0ABV9W6R2_9ACTN
MQRLADLVAGSTGVPVSVVSLVTADSQIMLGVAGGGAGFEIPLSASLCREVVITGLPFIARDAAADARFAGTELVAVHGIRAYAGFPVADEDGLILGVVSAAMHEPRAAASPPTSASRCGGPDRRRVYGAGAGLRRARRWVPMAPRAPQPATPATPAAVNVPMSPPMKPHGSGPVVTNQPPGS